MTVFTDILGKNNKYQQLHPYNNNTDNNIEEKYATVNFAHFVNGNNESKLQETLKLFLGLGVALGELQ